MKTGYVETKNSKAFNDAILTAKNIGVSGANTVLLVGEPGTGKTKEIDRFGALSNAVLLECMPEMGVTFVRDYLADRLSVTEGRKYDKHKAILEKLKESSSPIILDEAQHVVERGAKELEYIRRLADQTGSILILVCHTSEMHKFSEKKMAHIHTRIVANPVFKRADLEDCTLFVQQKAEVAVDDGIIKLIHTQSGGRYRKIENAIKTLEALGKMKSKDRLILADVKDMRLCEDVARGL